ncbi:MAG: TauD/TfdA family dioxygenase [Parvibaculaceae bacterium]
MNAPALMKNAEALGLTIEPLSPAIGSVIHGIDLTRPVSDELAALLRETLVERKVLFFRDQDITTEQHLDFARKFGELEVHPFAPSKPGYPEVLAITHNKESKGRENVWHSDVTWRLEPSLGSILRALEVPANGGDTLFANMEMAYDELDDAIKEQIDGAVAVHDFAHFRTMLQKRGLSEEEIEEYNKAYPEAIHPVVRTHPESGRKSIYVNKAFTQYIVGMEREASDALLQFLYSRAAIPEYQCRFQWQANSIAFWDNRAAQHYAVSDYWPALRRMERVTIIGDKPV